MDKPALMSDRHSADREIGIEIPPTAAIADHSIMANDVRDYLIRKEGKTYAGEHLLIDFWGCSRLNDVNLMTETLRNAAEAADATVLHIHVHEFGGEGGVSGVAVLAESHISVHTWPELDYAAFDVFMCGNCRPDKAVAVLERMFTPQRAEITEQRRGVVE